MTIHVLASPQRADTSGVSTAYDSVWAGGNEAGAPGVTVAPAQEQNALESVMLSHEKIYVVLAVVLIIWLGLTFLILRTDRRLSHLEERLEDPSQH